MATRDYGETDEFLMRWVIHLTRYGIQQNERGCTLKVPIMIILPLFHVFLLVESSGGLKVYCQWDAWKNQP